MLSTNVYVVVEVEDVVGERLVGFLEVVNAMVGVEDGRRVGVGVGFRVVGLEVVGYLVRVLEGVVVGNLKGRVEGDLEEI